MKCLHFTCTHEALPQRCYCILHEPSDTPAWVWWLAGISVAAFLLCIFAVTGVGN